MSEVLVCHPLDTIKVRMQLSRRAGLGKSYLGITSTAIDIIRKESPLGLYRGLGTVLGGIIPKMAIRFTSYEYYKRLLSDQTTMEISRKGIFLAGLAAGITEAVTVVNPIEVIKIRLQAPHKTPTGQIAPKYRSTLLTITTLIREEGVGFLYRGVTLTALRQGTNQAANFTVYTELKTILQRLQPQYAQKGELPSYQTTVIGLLSGAMGPFANAPIDTIKTRLQQTPALPGQSSLSAMTEIASDIIKKEGFRSFYKGITPRVMRVAPGQAVTFTVYEFLKNKIENADIMRLRQTI
ncbi:putative tricarboxylate transport protein [Talaromyces proteolyticus]|uniref:Tricarboxylate transport protein n=1 Tax=Talaromyces proteolyticus TaxID=1131652 RepID=A0AAD4KUS6_9EURO|nr:putative tricarboxylate transport protein [Talaromyces proteolyticus]KAH8701607.1 putative tricarboxylate transport protein [Talaromyces proteolyticus]